MWENLIGLTIKIIEVKNEPNSDYVNKIGKITNVSKDCYGDWRLEGSWGSIAIYPGVDKFNII